MNSYNSFKFNANSFKPTFWFEANSCNEIAENSVNKWFDKSGNGNHGVAGSTPPILKYGLKNGNKGIFFNNSDSTCFELGDLSAQFPNSAMLFIAYEPIAESHYVILNHGSGGDNSWWRWDGDGNGYFALWRTARIETYPLSMPTNGLVILSVASSSVNYEVIVNGISAGLQSPSYQAGTNYSIGRDPQNIGVRSFNGYVFEILAFNRILTDNESSVINAYLNNKYK